MVDPEKLTSSPKALHASKLAGSSWFTLLRLSRIRLAFVALWIFLCVKIMRDSVQLVDKKLQTIFLYEAFLYYNPLFMVALMLWFWGFNVFGLLQSRVSYPKVFDLDHNHLTHREIWKVALGLTLTILTSLTTYIHLYAHGIVRLAAWQPVLLYCLLPLLLALPFEVLYYNSRMYFLTTLFRLTFPLQPITFADFFVADVLTSMAKVLSDTERSVCRMSHAQVATASFLSSTDICGSHSVMIPLVLAYPYVCRFFQCLRQYSDTGERSALFNAVKYTSAFPVILLSATKYYVPVASWQGLYRPLWVLSGMVNTCYSFYWDISRDWDFGCFSGNCSSRNPLLRSNLYFSPRLVYYWAMVSNLVLRVSWTYKLSSHLRHNEVTVLVVAALEMFRRFQWIFFRVENEWNKMTIRSSLSEGSLPSLELDKGKEKEEEKGLLYVE